MACKEREEVGMIKIKNKKSVRADGMKATNKQTSGWEAIYDILQQAEDATSEGKTFFGCGFFVCSRTNEGGKRQRQPSKNAKPKTGTDSEKEKPLLSQNPETQALWRIVWNGTDEEKLAAIKSTKITRSMLVVLRKNENMAIAEAAKAKRNWRGKNQKP